MRIKTNDKYASIALKNRYENVKHEIELTAILNCVYSQKISNETIQTKVEHQLNSMNVSIDKINPKFAEKSKKYSLIKEQIFEILDKYEAILKQFCQKYDDAILDVILKKAELEFKLLMEIICKGDSNRKNQKNKQQEDWKKCDKKNKDMIKLEKEIKKLDAKIHDLNEQKVKKVLEAMEIGNKMLSTQIKRPHSFKSIKRFFTNKFNSYNVIQKTIIEPMNQRMNEFMVNELKEINIKSKEFDLHKLQEKIEGKRKEILKDLNHKTICKELGILGED